MAVKYERRHVSDELWNEIEPLLPKHPPGPRGGAPRADDRPCLEGVVHVLRTGCQWQELPKCPGRWPSGSTCWRRVAGWTRAGGGPRLPRVLLNGLGAGGAGDPSKAGGGSAPGGGQKRGA